MKENIFVFIFLIIIKIFINNVQGNKMYYDVIQMPSAGSDWRITFNSSSLTVYMNNKMESFLHIEIFNDKLKNSKIRFYCEKPHICNWLSDDYFYNITDSIWEGNISIKGNFLGKSKLCAKLILSNGDVKFSSECQNVIVLKEMGLVDQIFNISIAIVVTIIFISFGACLDIESLKEILLKPIGPLIGFSCQFILMPILSYLIGYILFFDDINMWLGIFFSGVSPGGGASNMWTLILKGNVNLSIVMTTISNLAAFFMMPLWIFTLGKTIFERENLGVPYEKIALFSVSFIIPLLIGLMMQKLQPKIAKLLVRLLKPITIIILIYIMIFATFTNLYLFKLFSWEIILAGMGLPWFGYILSYLFAWILRQNKNDCLTISIETGLQNTGIAIFLLRFSLEQPEADLTTVIPVAVGFMTLIPLLILYLIQRFCFDFTNVKEELDTSSKPKEEEEIMPS